MEKIGKYITIFLFLSFLATSIIIFKNRNRPIEVSEGGSKNPKVLLKDFTLRKFVDNQEVGQISAKYGHVIDPNIIEMVGDVKGTRFSNFEREDFNSELATAFLESENVGSILNSDELEVEKVEFSGLVNVSVKQHNLSTDYAEYISETESLNSDRPVRIEGPGRVMFGNLGFEYSFKDSGLYIPGKVKGTVRHEN